MLEDMRTAIFSIPFLSSHSPTIHTTPTALHTEEKEPKAGITVQAHTLSNIQQNKNNEHIINISKYIQYSFSLFNSVPPSSTDIKYFMAHAGEGIGMETGSKNCSWKSSQCTLLSQIFYLFYPSLFPS